MRNMRSFLPVKQMSRKTRKRMGGKRGTLKRVVDLNSASILGAGGYGIVVNPNGKKEVFKLFFDLAACKKVAKEAEIQQKAHILFKTGLPEVGIPSVTYHTNEVLEYHTKKYLCGIGMENVPPPEGFEEAVHMLLGYHKDDIDTSWGQTQSKPVSSTNPTRGFFASPEMMEIIWKEEGNTMTIDRLAGLMGKSYRLLLNGGIIPIDVEWIYSQGKPWIIDFGLCEVGQMSPEEFLVTAGSRGLATDFYVPHKGDRGYEAFIKEFLHLLV